MPEFLRPDSNVTQTSWTGGFADIDEATASDTDFAYGANNSGTATLEVGLTNPTSGSYSSRTCTVRWRYAKVSSGTLSGTGGTVTQTCTLYEGTTSRGSSTVTTSGTWTAGSFTFDAATISDWTDLRLRFTQSTSGGGGNARGSAVSWAELEIPDTAQYDLTETETGTGTISASVDIVRGATSSLTGVPTLSAVADTFLGALVSLDAFATSSAAALLDVNNGIRFTEDSNRRVTETGDRRVLQGFTFSGFTYSETLSLSAALTATSSAQRIVNGTFAVSGVATLASAASVSRSAAASIAGAGTTTLVAALTSPASWNQTGTGAVSGAVSLTRNGASILAGTAAFSNAVSLIRNANGSLVGSLATLSASTFSAGAVLSVTGQASIAPTADRFINLVSPLSGSGTVSGKAGYIHYLSETESGAGSITLAPTITRSVASSLAGSAAIALAPTRTVTGSYSVAGSGSTSATPSLIRSGISSLTGTGTVAANGELGKFIYADLYAVSTAGISPLRIIGIATLRGGSGVFTASPTVFANLSAPLSTNGTLNGIANMLLTADYGAAFDRRVTQSGDVRITQSGDYRVISGAPIPTGTVGATATTIPFVQGLYAKKSGAWRAVQPKVYYGDQWVVPTIYVKQNNIWKRVY